MDYMLKSSDERVVINDFIQGDPLSEENLDKTLELVSNLRKVDFANPCKMGVSEVKNSDEIRLLLPNKSIWIYSGYTWNQVMYPVITDDFNPSRDELLLKRKEIVKQCNVMVDGRYIDSKRDITLKWRGSSNQRVIDINKTLENKNGKIIIYTE